jgi:saccharopine dehydrogenase (NAD+, L-lysine-forming)
MNPIGRVSLPGPLFLFGAYGKTGTMIAKVAVEHGHDIVLSGSDRDRLNRLSTEMSVPAAPARLDDQAALRKLIRAAACVIHVAGPFAATFRPMLEACSAEAVPYVDLNGQLDVFRSMEDFVARQQPTIPILSGVGFGVVAGESAAMHAASMLEQPQRIWLGLVPDLGLRSPGATASTFDTLAHGGAVVENGQFVAERMGRRSFTGTFAGRREKFISMPLGELWAVRRSTGVSSVVAGVKRPAPERLMLQSGGLQLLARSPKIRNWLVARLSRGGTQNGRVFESKVWARAEDREGQTAVAFLTMGEGYQWSAESAVRAAEQVAFDRRPGLWTPGQYLGKGFALGIPSTKLFELSAAASS